MGLGLDAEAQMAAMTWADMVRATSGCSVSRHVRTPLDADHGCQQGRDRFFLAVNDDNDIARAHHKRTPGLQHVPETGAST